MEANIKVPELKKPTPARAGNLKSNSPLQLFFIEALKDIYWAEKELVKALPDMLAAVTTAALSKAVAEAAGGG